MFIFSMYNYSVIIILNLMNNSRCIQRAVVVWEVRSWRLVASRFLAAGKRCSCAQLSSHWISSPAAGCLGRRSEKNGAKATGPRGAPRRSAGISSSRAQIRPLWTPRVGCNQFCKVSAAAACIERFTKEGLLIGSSKNKCCHGNYSSYI